MTLKILTPKNKVRKSTLAPKFHSSTKVEFTTSSPFFANAMLVAGVIRYRFGRPL
jgi:hypothetical protein